MNKRQRKKFNKKLGHKKWAYVKRVLRRNKEWVKNNPELAEQLKPFIWDGKSAITPFSRSLATSINNAVRDETNVALKAMIQQYYTGDIENPWGIDKNGEPVIMELGNKISGEYGDKPNSPEGYSFKGVVMSKNKRTYPMSLLMKHCNVIANDFVGELPRPTAAYVAAETGRKKMILEKLAREEKERTGEITPEEVQARKMRMLDALDVGVYGSLTDADKFYEEASKALNKGGDESGD